MKLASFVIVALAAGEIGACGSGHSVGNDGGGTAGTLGGSGGANTGRGGTGAGMGGGGSGGNFDGGAGGVTGSGGGGGTVSGDAGTTSCAGTCAANEVCVLNLFGAVSYVCPDAGHVTFPPNCDGRVLDQYGCCYGVEDWTYGCVARPSSCGATVTCACGAATLCPSGGCWEMSATEIGCLKTSP